MCLDNWYYVVADLVFSRFDQFQKCLWQVRCYNYWLKSMWNLLKLKYELPLYIGSLTTIKLMFWILFVSVWILLMEGQGHICPHWYTGHINKRHPLLQVFFSSSSSSSVLLQFFFNSSSVLLQFFFSSSSVLLQFFFSSS